jgi:hypothetical protein
MNHHPEFRKHIVTIEDIVKLLVKYTNHQKAVTIGRYLLSTESLSDKQIIGIIEYFKSFQEYKSRAAVLDFIQNRIKIGNASQTLKNTALYLIEELCVTLTLHVLHT